MNTVIVTRLDKMVHSFEPNVYPQASFDSQGYLHVEAVNLDGKKTKMSYNPSQWVCVETIEGVVEDGSKEETR